MSEPRRALIVLLCVAGSVAGTARAQDSDDAIQRQESIGTLHAVLLRAEGAGLIRPDAGDSASTAGRATLGLSLASLEKKGAAWEAVRLDGHGWLGDTLEVRAVLLDLDMWMLGTDQEGDLCIASPTVLHLGDCVDGGLFGLHAQVADVQYETAGGRWFARWLAGGVVLNPVGDSFDVDFVTHRLPIRVGASLDHTWNLAPADGDESDLRLRGLAGVDWLLRFAGYRVEIEASARFRPSLAPFDLEDFGAEARLRIGYLFLGRLLGSAKPTIQRITLDAAYGHWTRPALADRWIWTGAEDGFEISIGLELSFRDVTPT